MGLILVGFLGGLLTGISPCILPVLPVLFFAGGTQAARDDLHNGNVFGGRRPYLVILGLVLSFSFFTLAGTFLLTLLHLPETTIIWIGIVALVLVGVGMIVPRFERILEKPFAWIPQREANPDHGGFLLGIALGAVFIPCAGPVLAVVAIAGAKSEISWNILVETAAFAVGVAIPLLVFALAGRGLAERIKGFRRHQRGIRITAGVTMLVLAVAVIPVFNLPQYLLTLVPDYTNGLQSQAAALNKTATTSATCTLDASHVENCGTAPNFVGITQWFNTKNDKPLTLKSLRGKVVLVDFWAYSCINCQRSTPHLNAWYKSYEKDGFVIVGVHAPEYAFEHVPSNVLASAKQQGIKYPIALDNNFDTWDAYQNQYWPAEYLLDGTGKIRHVSFGEGSYGATEAVIRSLLTEEHPGITLPKPTDVPDKTPTNQLTSETYLGSDRAPAENFVSPSGYQAGTGTYTFPKGAIGLDDYAFSGTFAVAGQSITAKDGPASIRLHYQASHVYLNVGGTGTLTVKDSQGTRVVPISGVPNIRDVLAPGGYRDSTVTITMSKGLTAYSFTFG